MVRETKYFSNLKEDHTLETFQCVEQRLINSEIKKIVLASTTGRTAIAALDYFKDKDVQLIIIPHQYDFSRKDNPFPQDLVDEIRKAGHQVHFGTMLFHTDKLFGINVPSVIANFLRCFCEGVKVCYEIVLMATDAGLLKIGETVIAIAGTGRGADTALYMQASSSQNLKRLRVQEILCKPVNEYVDNN